MYIVYSRVGKLQQSLLLTLRLSVPSSPLPKVLGGDGPTVVDQVVAAAVEAPGNRVGRQGVPEAGKSSEGQCVCVRVSPR